MVAGGLSGDDSYGGYRMRLVETLQSKGIHDLGVLRAVSLVPRHRFVPESVKHRAYEDAALPIGGGQTISQPWVQARYIEVLRLTGKENVLEVGTGSGYQTALLAMLADRVRSSIGSLEKRLQMPRAHVTVENGTVILHGEVPNNEAEAEIVKAVEGIAGVRDVRSHLTTT